MKASQVAYETSSSVLKKDAWASFAGAVLSLGTFLGALIFQVDEDFWWIDPTCVPSPSCSLSGELRHRLTLTGWQGGDDHRHFSRSLRSPYADRVSLVDARVLVLVASSVPRRRPTPFAVVNRKRCTVQEYAYHQCLQDA
jgi:hypothetical protein